MRRKGSAAGDAGIAFQLLGAVPFGAGQRVGSQIRLQMRIGIHHHRAQLDHAEDAPTPPDALLHVERIMPVAGDIERGETDQRHDHGCCQHDQPDIEQALEDAVIEPPALLLRTGGGEFLLGACVFLGAVGGGPVHGLMCPVGRRVQPVGLSVPLRHTVRLACCCALGGRLVGVIVQIGHVHGHPACFLAGTVDRHTALCVKRSDGMRSDLVFMGDPDGEYSTIIHSVTDYKNIPQPCHGYSSRAGTFLP